MDSPARSLCSWFAHQLELISIAHRDAATCTVHTPTDSAMEAVTDIFEIDKHFVMIINLICTTNAYQSVAGKRRIEWNERVVVRDEHAINRSAEWQQPVLYLCLRLAR